MENAKRSILQATYTPIRVYKAPGTWGNWNSSGRALEKFTFVASINPSHSELQQLKDRLAASSDSSESSSTQETLQSVDVIESTLPQLGTSSALRSAAYFRDLDPITLVAIARNVIELRREKLVMATEAQDSLVRAYLANQIPRASALAVAQPVPSARLATQTQSVFVEKGSPLRVRAIALRSEDPQTRLAPVTVKKEPKQEPGVNTPMTPPAVSVGTLINWAIEHGVETESSVQSLNFATNLLPGTAELGLASFNDVASAYINQLFDTVDAFSERMVIEPAGFLHLERLTFTPAGIERGELVYSLPLAPGEEVNISHREWSNTSQEFEKIVTDFMENYSEEGVTEKSELAESTSSQQQHSSGYNTQVGSSGGFGPFFQASASFSYNASDSANSSEQSSRKNSNEITRKASSRVKQEHKTSFRVVNAAGTEDQTMRRIKNPFPEKAMRIDYYQLIRKWKVDLYRYGVRLTYDLTIPDPGWEIVSKIAAIKAIKDELELEFSFPLRPTDIDRNNYLERAADYNTRLPPDLQAAPQESQTKSFPAEITGLQAKYYALEVDIDERYLVDTAYVVNPHAHPHFGDGNPWFWIEGFDEVTGNVFDWDLNFNRIFPSIIVPSETPLTRKFRGQSGKLWLGYGSANVWAAEFELRMELVLKPEAYQLWRFNVWDALRNAALAQYDEHRQRLAERLSRLQEELGAQDALSLRKLEREEVMKVVLRWLFGPGFNFFQPFITASHGPGIDEPTWRSGLVSGEMIKFVQQAIEWENFLYILYPYFWSSPERWELKKYLDHPDFMHKAFLKSGSARVVLTIRPGFERDFLTFIHAGDRNGALPWNHPYVRLAEELENFARTNYPGIRSANPVEDARPLLYPKQKKAWAEMQIIMRLVDAYFTTNGIYPSTLAQLQALVPYNDGINPTITTVPLRDPWGHEYVYTSPGVYGNYDLVSYGANGVSGGEDENADIASWVDSSLIGTWYEYTPTSAMDIALAMDNESQPAAAHT